MAKKQIPYQRKDHYSNNGLPKQFKTKPVSIYYDPLKVYQLVFRKNSIEFIDHLHCFNHYIIVPKYDIDGINIANLLQWWRFSSNHLAKHLSGQAYLKCMQDSFRRYYFYIHYEKNMSLDNWIAMTCNLPNDDLPF